MELRQDARANRERIIEAATEAFAERGLGVEMKELADRAGVAVGTIYRHFPSKEELLTAIGRALIADAVADAEACTAISDPLEALTALLAGNLRRGQRYGSLFVALLGGELPRHHLEQLRAEAKANSQDTRLRAILERGMGEGLLRADLDPGIASAMLQSVTMPWSYAAIAEGREPHALAQAIMHDFLLGAGVPEQKQEREADPIVGGVPVTGSTKG